MWITGKKITKSSVWRCKCGDVYYWSGWLWNDTGIGDWERLGGHISNQVRVRASEEDEDEEDDLDEDEEDEDDYQDEEECDKCGF